MPQIGVQSHYTNAAINIKVSTCSGRSSFFLSRPLPAGIAESLLHPNQNEEPPSMHVSHTNRFLAFLAHEHTERSACDLPTVV